MTRNESIAAAKPMLILATAILCIVAEKPACCPRFILFEMKYERFNVITNFSALVIRAK